MKTTDAGVQPSYVPALLIPPIYDCCMTWVCIIHGTGRVCLPSLASVARFLVDGMRRRLMAGRIMTNELLFSDWWCAAWCSASCYASCHSNQLRGAVDAGPVYQARASVAAWGHDRPPLGGPG